MIESNKEYAKSVSGIVGDKVKTDILEMDKYEVFELSDGNIWEYHIFEGNKYNGSIYLPNQWGCDPNVHYEVYNNHTWLIVDELIGRGTGLIEKEQVWYDLSSSIKKESIRFTSLYKYFSERGSCNTEYIQNVLDVGEDEDGFFIRTEIQRKYYQNKKSDELLWEEKVERKYTLIDNKISDMAYFSQIGFALYDKEKSDEDIFCNNYDKLLEIASGNDNEKKEWLKEFLDTINLDERIVEINNLLNQ